jgi:hypothetical protein
VGGSKKKTVLPISVLSRSEGRHSIHGLVMTSKTTFICTVGHCCSRGGMTAVSAIGTPDPLADGLHGATFKEADRRSASQSGGCNPIWNLKVHYPEENCKATVG